MVRQTTFFAFFLGLNILLSAQPKPFTVADAINVKSFAIHDVCSDGAFMAGLMSSRHHMFNVDHTRHRDPSYVGQFTSDLYVLHGPGHEMIPLFDKPAVHNNLRLSPDGQLLAFLRYEYETTSLYIYDVRRNRIRKVNIKTDHDIASNSPLVWTPDGGGVVLAFREHGWKEIGDSMYTEATKGPITVYDSSQPFLKWEKINHHASLSKIGLVSLDNRKVSWLLEEARYSNIRISADGTFLSYEEVHPKKSAYDRRNEADYELKYIRLDQPDEMHVLIEKSTNRINVTWNPDNDVFATIDSNRVALRAITEEKMRILTSDTVEISGTDTTKVQLRINRWRPDGKKILATSSRGYWLVDAENGNMENVYRFPEDRKIAPELNISQWSPDGRFLYLTYSAHDKWERGMISLDLDELKTKNLILDSNLYTRWRLSDSGKYFIYQKSDGDMPPDYYMANADFTESRRLTDLNPWMRDRKISKSELVSYRDADGELLYGILYYPVDYEPGKQYPLVCELYESFFHNGYRLTMQLIANEGYFAFLPSVNFIEGYPAEAWIKGVTSGINKLIDRGFIDEKKIGVYGVSYGGYATSLLISQTDRFAAAINISGKVNIISFLGDSPRIGRRNYTAAEMGQDRIGATLWEAPMKYIATSAVLHADRINTPHLLMTGEGDWNVPASNTRELYYALRRLDKEVVWVNYHRGGHVAGLASTESDFYDHWQRMFDWFDKYFTKE